ncbi:NAD(P)-dependent alcohol dehydrogenase [Solimonas soli]|uniref:NAD(P)-dependent alcohol dehydrogenase n=1 Tax=Solimonas soli TaxID=413479 RepID=UPI000488BE64|nr:NAD(P)-dependent alcohol dehydrogenase [Solimonas soli]
MSLITAAVLREPGGDFALETLTLAAPARDEVRVRLAGTGICHTDLHIRDGGLPFPLPAILGHEGAGIVEAIGTGVSHVQPGDAVVLTFAACGHCPACRQSRPPYCEHGQTLNFSGHRDDGSAYATSTGAPVTGRFFGQSSFATHTLAHRSCVVRVPHDVPLALMGAFGCSLQTGAGAVLRVLEPSAGESIAIFGVGAVGMAAVMAARIAGCTTIIAVDRHRERLRLAMELGATCCIDAASERPVRRIAELTGGGVHGSVECTGVPDVLTQAVRVLRVGGSCAMLGLPAVGVEVSLPMLHLLNGRSVHGVMEGDSDPATFIPQLIGHWRAGRFPFERLLTRFALADVNVAMAAAKRGDVIKAVVVP